MELAGALVLPEIGHRTLGLAIGVGCIDNQARRRWEKNIEIANSHAGARKQRRHYEPPLLRRNPIPPPHSGQCRAKRRGSPLPRTGGRMLSLSLARPEAIENGDHFVIVDL